MEVLLGLVELQANQGPRLGEGGWDLSGWAVDLAGLLLDWHRLRLAGEEAFAPAGAERLAGRIVEIAEDHGRRCGVAYGAVARLGLAAQRYEPDTLRTWRGVTDALLASLC